MKRINQFKPYVFKDPFKSDFLGINKEQKQKPERIFHTITAYEKSLIQLLTPAIQSKIKIKFWYSDTTKDNDDWRIVEPHLIGQNKTTGNIMLSAWFLPTDTQVYYGDYEKWGTYNLSFVSKLEILGEAFNYTREFYNPEDKRMCNIFCRTQLLPRPLFG